MASGNLFDVIIIGAGPSGSLTADILARASLCVALLEEHPAVGFPVHCSGLVSPRTLEIAGVDEELVGLEKFHQARVWGPTGKTLFLRSNRVQAIAIDRPRFDQILAKRAAHSGARLILNAKATKIEKRGDLIYVEIQSQKWKQIFCAPLLIGADGANSRVSRWMNRRTPEMIPARKADIIFQDGGTDSIEIFLGQGIAPGFFGWVIPIHDGLARIGIGAKDLTQRRYEDFLDMLQRRFGKFIILEQVGAVLPLGPARNFTGDGVMLVGAAANQTKPTTGGGLFFGLRAAELAAAMAIEASASGDYSNEKLAKYEERWHQLDGKELLYHHWLQKIFHQLTDIEINLLVMLLNIPCVQHQINRLGDIDYPSRLFGHLTDSLQRTTPLPDAIKTGPCMDAQG